MRNDLQNYTGSRLPLSPARHCEQPLKVKRQVLSESTERDEAGERLWPALGGTIAPIRLKMYGAACTAAFFRAGTAATAATPGNGTPETGKKIETCQCKNDKNCKRLHILFLHGRYSPQSFDLPGSRQPVDHTSVVVCVQTINNENYFQLIFFPFPTLGKRDLLHLPILYSVGQ